MSMVHHTTTNEYGDVCLVGTYIQNDSEYLAYCLEQTWPDILGESKVLGGSLTATMVGNTVNVVVCQHPEEVADGEDPDRRTFVITINEV